MNRRLQNAPQTMIVIYFEYKPMGLPHKAASKALRPMGSKYSEYMSCYLMFTGKLFCDYGAISLNHNEICFFAYL